MQSDRLNKTESTKKGCSLLKFQSKAARWCSCPCLLIKCHNIISLTRHKQNKTKTQKKEIQEQRVSREALQICSDRWLPVVCLALKKKKHKSKKVYCLEIISIWSASPTNGRQYGFLIFLILCFELWNKFRLLSFYASLKDGGLQVVWKSFANELHSKQHSRQHAAVVFQNRLTIVIYLLHPVPLWCIFKTTYLSQRIVRLRREGR